MREARLCGARVIDRCNLTILHEPGLEDLAGFLAGQKVKSVASLPCYSMELQPFGNQADVTTGVRYEVVTALELLTVVIFDNFVHGQSN